MFSAVSLILNVQILLCHFHIKRYWQAKLNSKLDEEDASDAMTRLSRLATTVSMPEFHDVVTELTSLPYHTTIASYVSYWLRKKEVSPVFFYSASDVNGHG